MSYEREMLIKLKMPEQKEVEQKLLLALFEHNGAIKEFSENEESVDKIANVFGLSENQRSAYLETVYKKENRIKRSFLWHRLLFRSADSLAKQGLISRPTATFLLTNKREWMLTESGYDKVLEALHIPNENKFSLNIRSYEVQKIATALLNAQRPTEYLPIDQSKRHTTVKNDVFIRQRGFRLAVLDAYDYKCAICGLKLHSPQKLLWEAEAAHIVPHSFRGKDDVFNGISFCRLHHWAFDNGWFSINDNFTVSVSTEINRLEPTHGIMGEYQLMKALANPSLKIILPLNEMLYPHESSIRWHRQNVFNKL